MGLRDRYIRPKVNFRDATLARVLTETSARGGFSACVLATADGLPIAAFPSEMDAETTSAMIALLQESVQRAQQGMSLPVVDEVAALFMNGIRLVCRTFDVCGSPFILAAMLPNGRDYRGVMDDAIARTTAAWATEPASADMAVPAGLAL